MKNKQLKNLSRTQLMEIVSKQGQEIERLREDSAKESRVEEDDIVVDMDADQTLPDDAEISDITTEVDKRKYHKRFRKTLRSTISTLIVVAAIAVLVATLWLPVLQIYGNSMTPTLNSGEVVVTLKAKNIKTGDIIAFYYNNKILIKRVIATSGDWVDIDEEGNVYVNNELLDEPYVTEKAFGDCNIDLPYQVPESKYFVMGDHRSTSVDSRNTSIGCVSEEQVVGHLVVRLWPLNSIDKLE
jgi:signal peptidase I